MTMFQIIPIPAFEDNDIWAYCQPENSHCILVDPGHGEKAQEFLSRNNKQLCAVLITHHHRDHTGGIAYLSRLWPGLRIIGPDSDNPIAGLTERVKNQQQVEIAEMAVRFDVLTVPGHTLDHIAFYSAPVLFCGDTLFSAGCGRLFEGSAGQMWSSLEKIMALPDDTLLYCTHEYTLANIRFAKSAEPDNAALSAYEQHCLSLRANNQPTLPALLANEKKINPFLRCNNKKLQLEWQRDSALALFTALRKAKDSFNA